MSPKIDSKITVLIDGVDKTDLLKRDSVFIRLVLNNKGSVAELKFFDYRPPEREQITIDIDGTVVFGGYIVRNSATLVGIKNSHKVLWSTECKDWSEILESQIVNKEYAESTDRAIIQDLFTTYLSAESFDTSSDVATVDSDLDITFTNVTVREALEQLASRVGANWYIKPNKRIYWFDPGSPQDASFDISSSPNDSTSFGFLQNSLSYDIDASTIVNRVIINGGTQSTGTKVQDTFTGTGSQKTFVLSQIPDSILYVDFTDSNSNHYVTYGSFIGYAPGDSIADGFKVIVDVENKTLTCEGDYGTAPKSGVDVIIEYYYKEGINFTVDDESSQAQYGVYK
jgi:hypothetical protein